MLSRWLPTFDAIPTRYANRAAHPSPQNGESGRRQTGHRPGTHVEDHVHKAQAKTQKSGLWCCDMASCHHIEVTTSLLREHEVRRHRRWSRKLENELKAWKGEHARHTNMSILRLILARAIYEGNANHPFCKLCERSCESVSYASMIYRKLAQSQWVLIHIALATYGRTANLRDLEAYTSQFMIWSHNWLP